MNPNAPKAPDDSHNPKRPWCLFYCGPSPFAIALEAVAEVVEVERLTRFPLNAPGVLGVCTLRREVIPVIDPQDGPPSSSAKAEQVTKPVVLLLRTARGTWALRVNSEGTTVAEAPLEQSYVAGERTPRDVIRRGEVMHAVLDPEEAWRKARLSVEQWHRQLWGPEPHSPPVDGAAPRPAETLPPVRKGLK